VRAARAAAPPANLTVRASTPLVNLTERAPGV
jgi:hypothetical protein